MRDFLIRKATINDIDAMLVIENSCFTTDKLSKRQITYLLKKAKAICLVAERKDKIVGNAICLLPAHPRPARLYSIAVLPHHQGKGIAKQFFTHLFLVLEQQRYHRCRLEVRESQLKVQALYQKLGFDNINLLPYYYQDGESAVRMEIDLSSA